MLVNHRLVLLIGFCCALAAASPTQADTQRWLGQAPFCTAKPADCAGVGMTFVRTHASGDGNTCLTGEKVMCAATNSVGGNAPNCPTNARTMGRTLTCMCSAKDMTSGTVWGTDTYTNDSKICRAARHAGVIPASGGVVTLVKRPGQNSYNGSSRNGISTRQYGKWGGSFVFQR